VEQKRPNGPKQGGRKMNPFTLFSRTWFGSKNTDRILALALLPAILWLGAPTASYGSGPEDNDLAFELPRVSLSWVDHYKLFDRGHKGMTKEVDAIFDEVGVEIVWHKGLTEQPPSDAIHLNVVLMPGDSSGWGLGNHAMGVVVGDLFPRQTLYVFLPNILRTLGLRLKPGRAASARETNELARAVGRVVAHELVHAFCPDRPHTETGLMNALLNRKVLRGGQLVMIPSTEDAFLGGLQKAWQMAQADEDTVQIAGMN
jgi:hypothetical protein